MDNSEFGLMCPASTDYLCSKGKTIVAIALCFKIDLQPVMC